VAVVGAGAGAGSGITWASSNERSDLKILAEMSPAGTFEERIAMTRVRATEGFQCLSRKFFIRVFIFLLFLLERTKDCREDCRRESNLLHPECNAQHQ